MANPIPPIPPEEEERAIGVIRHMSKVLGDRMLSEEEARRLLDATRDKMMEAMSSVPGSPPKEPGS